jgi:hypothetical protein
MGAAGRPHRCGARRRSSAALRELHEEIGLDLTAREVLGTLDDYPTRSGYLITPVVAWGGDHPPLRLNPQEVASLRRIRLADITREDAIEFDTIPESERRVVRLRVDGRSIHAPTAALIYQFREILCGRIPASPTWSSRCLPGGSAFLPLPACGQRSTRRSAAKAGRVRGTLCRGSPRKGPSPARYARDLSPQAGRG